MVRPSRGAAHLSQQQHIGRALPGRRAVLQQVGDHDWRVFAERLGEGHHLLRPLSPDCDELFHVAEERLVERHKGKVAAECGLGLRVGSPPPRQPELCRVLVILPVRWGATVNNWVLLSSVHGKGAALPHWSPAVGDLVAAADGICRRVVLDGREGVSLGLAISRQRQLREQGERHARL